MTPIHPSLRAGFIGAAFAALVAGVLVRDLHASPANGLMVTDVQAMQARLPDCKRCDPAKTTGAYARTGDAVEIATAIAYAARTPLEAAELVTYAAFESANHKTAVSSDGFDLGAWQLRGVDREVAFDPRRAAPTWIAFADASRAHCTGNPVGTELAALVSGSCDHGRDEAKLRDAIAHRILASLPKR